MECVSTRPGPFAVYALSLSPSVRH
uniref:Uncharacterized protein n=1 Tax=Anguilla anguilla TaxID=7936 RepID=A0A0E9UNZ7_ANGAN